MTNAVGASSATTAQSLQEKTASATDQDNPALDVMPPPKGWTTEQLEAFNKSILSNTMQQIQPMFDKMKEAIQEASKEE